MKDFENNENVNETEKNVNTEENRSNVSSADSENTNTNVNANANEEHREVPVSENPYFKGFGEYKSDVSPDAPQYGRSEEKKNENHAGAHNSAGGDNGTIPPQNRYNPYAGQNRYNYSQQYGAQYSSPSQNNGQISYTPNNKNTKKKSGVSKGALAAVVAICVILSGAAGFGGTMLAGSLRGDTTVSENGGVSDSDNTAKVNAGGGNVVIYKSVDNVSTSTGTDGSGNYTTAQVAAMVKDSVVEITTEYRTSASRWYNYVQTGAGSGVIISEDGYIITNTHVITDESTGAVADTITVRLTDGNTYPADVVGYDSDADIAIIKIAATGLTAAQCGDSDKLTVGEELLVVGNPLGELGGTVTNGIVSATEREIEVNGVKMNLIQTNAAVNPGNSGGGMFNMKGQLVGIVNAKSSGTGIEGLGFAIPIDEALSVTEQLLEYGYVRGKPMIGVTFTEVSNNNFLFYYNIKAGVYVDSLTEGYNDKVLEVGDRIVAVNGTTISSSSEIKAIVTSSAVGDKLTFQVERNGKLTEVEVTCYEKKPTTAQKSDIEFDGSTQNDTANGNLTDENGNSVNGGDVNPDASGLGEDICGKLFGGR